MPLTAVIDIGSNSVRLVVYRGAGRNPQSLFNEKVMCELGRGIGALGRIDEENIERAVGALSRFAALARDMDVDNIRIVATAAVREADNSQEFLRQVEARTGLAVQVISGEAEAEYSALGVISGTPDADGVMGDLGGGSLELVRIAKGQMFERVSLPLGPFALEGLGLDARDQQIRKAMATVPWLKDCAGKPFYMVGGAWRALCHLHMHLGVHPLPIIHAYRLSPDDLDPLLLAVSALDRQAIKAVPNLSDRRVPTLPLAIALLKAVAARMKAPTLIASAYGLREGLLYADLDEATRAQDPLITACQDEAEQEGRFPAHGDILRAWMEPLFLQDDQPGDARLRHAACLLADVAWRGHPDFRARRAVDASLYGNFVGVDAHGRLLIAAALNSAYGGDGLPARFASSTIASKADLRRAHAWGLAIRLGQRLSGGTADALRESTLNRRGELLNLTLSNEAATLYGEVVERRLKALAEALKLKARFRVL
jgi:exopolyphosphatase / guanosine-5'-triphosphate,3'-diphosphate pyrophosphatase